MNKSINESINKSINGSINESINESIEILDTFGLHKELHGDGEAAKPRSREAGRGHSLLTSCMDSAQLHTGNLRLAALQSIAGGSPEDPDFVDVMLGQLQSHMLHVWHIY